MTILLWFLVFLHPFLIKKHYSCIEMFDGVSHWFFFSYTVNITFGICSCMVGKDSSPCEHQYVLWVTNVGHCINFILVFSVCLTSVFQVCMSKATETMKCKAHI